ncbi:MAG: sialidase family protein [Chloroflexi bacterium OHK40]
MARATTIYLGTAEGLLIGSQEGPQGHWRLARHALLGHAVRAILLVGEEALLVAVDGLPPQQSFDEGLSWSNATGASIEPVGLRAMSATGPRHLSNPRLLGATAYAILGGRAPVLVGAGAGGGMLFRSFDDGIHWEPAGVVGEVAGRITAITPGAGALWAGTDAGQLLRSNDRGASWREAGRTSMAILCLAAGPQRSCG